MRVRLQYGEALPRHNSNSNVLLLPLEGAVRVETPGASDVARAGEAVSVRFDTQMDVSNGGECPLTFLVIKTPHPRKMAETSR